MGLNNHITIDQSDHRSDRAKLLQNLKREVYCRLGVSKIQGIGVIAIKSIPKGVDPFHSVDEDCKLDQVVYLSSSDLSRLPKAVQKIIQDFFCRNSNGLYPVSSRGPNAMDISYYMNHSKTPNVDLVFQPGCAYMEFRTNRRIKTGEELLINYGNCSNHFQ